MNFGFYIIIFGYIGLIGYGIGWGFYEFFVFLVIIWLVNGLV